MTAGRHREAGAYNPYVGAYASETTWIDYLVRDCVDHFASLRTSIQAALASSGKLAVSGTRQSNYIVTGRISEVSGGGPADPAQPNKGFSISSSRMFVNMDVTVRTPGGRIIYGGLLTKTLETGFNMETPGLSSTSRKSGQALYTELQHEVALAVARMVAFKLNPLRVTGVSGKRITLNYGTPLVPLGAVVQVNAPDQSIVRYDVTASGPQFAQADYSGGAYVPEVVQGNLATLIDSDDPAANGRRFEKVDLP